MIDFLLLGSSVVLKYFPASRLSRSMAARLSDGVNFPEVWPNCPNGMVTWSAYQDVCKLDATVPSSFGTWKAYLLSSMRPVLQLF